MHHTNRLLASAAIFCMIGALSACGGGSGGAGGGGSPVPAAPLEVNAITPLANAKYVKTRTEFVVSFGSALSAAGLTAGQVQLSDGTQVYPVKIAIVGPVVTLTPLQNLNTQTDYQLTIKAGVVAANGAVLKNDFVLKFHTLRSVYEARQLTPGGVSVPGPDAQRVRVVDVNGDGRADLVEFGALYRPDLFAANGYTINVFLQDAAGNFETLQNIELVADQNVYDKYFSDLLVLDVDADGKPELLVPEYRPNDEDNTGIRVFKLDAKGKFAEHEWIATNYAEFLKAVDVDGDGKTDLVGTNDSAIDQVTGGFQVLRQTATGFVKLAPVTRQGGREFGVGDLDQDGKRELIFNNTNALQIYSQGAPGAFALNASLSNETVNFCAAYEQCQEMEVIDVNGDGKEELVFISRTPLGQPANNHLLAFARAPAGGLTKKIDAMMGFNTGLFGIHDMDGDGVRDFLIISPFPTPYFEVVGGKRDYALDFSNLMPLRTSGVLQRNVTIADVDGDGRPDIVLDDYNDGIWVERNLKN